MSPSEPFVVPDRPYRHLSNEVLSGQIAVCRATLTAILESTSGIRGIITSCRRKGDTDNVAYAEGVLARVREILQDTRDDCESLVREQDLRLERRSN